MKEDLECQDCGTKDESVEETTDPYEEELYNNTVDIVVCSKCYYIRGCEI